MQSILKKRLLPSGLLARFLMIIILPICICQFGAIYLFYQRHWYNVSSNHSQLIVTEIVELIEQVKSSDIKEQEGEFLNLRFRIIDKSLFPKYDKKYVAEELLIFHNLLRDKLTNQLVLVPDDSRNVELYIMLMGDDVLNVTLPYKSLLTPTTHIFVLWSLSLGLVSLMLAILFSRQQIKSIIELTNALEKFGSGRKDVAYRPSGATEIRQAGDAFLQMKKRIEDYNSKRTQFLAMISHDLRTPLTRMQLQVSMMENIKDKEDLLGDVNDMSNMISSYLDFAEGEIKQQMLKIDINNVIVKYVQSHWKEGGVILNIDKKPVYVMAHQISLIRAFTNIINNAIKYSQKVQISSMHDEYNAVFLIEDNGIGIPDDQKKQVFQPFYRADKSRSLDSSTNVGLGLAITKEIIENHNGQISLHNSAELRGLMVKIIIPRII